jgi:hypothetical protein
MFFDRCLRPALDAVKRLCEIPDCFLETCCVRSTVCPECAHGSFKTASGLNDQLECSTHSFLKQRSVESQETLQAISITSLSDAAKALGKSTV